MTVGTISFVKKTSNGKGTCEPKLPSYYAHWFKGTHNQLSIKIQIGFLKLYSNLYFQYQQFKSPYVRYFSGNYLLVCIEECVFMVAYDV